MLRKTDFISAYAAKRGITKSHATGDVNCMLDILCQAINSYGGVSFTGYLTLRKVLRKSRTCKNPATGQTITTKDSYSISAKIGNKLKELLNY